MLIPIPSTKEFRKLFLRQVFTKIAAISGRTQTVGTKPCTATAFTDWMRVSDAQRMLTRLGTLRFLRLSRHAVNKTKATV